MKVYVTRKQKLYAQWTPYAMAKVWELDIIDCVKSAYHKEIDESEIMETVIVVVVLIFNNHLESTQRNLF